MVVTVDKADVELLGREVYVKVSQSRTQEDRPRLVKEHTVPSKQRFLENSRGNGPGSNLGSFNS